MLRLLLKNPLSIWFKRTIVNYKIQRNNRGKKLKIGYMCNMADCIYGYANSIYDNAELSNVELGDYTYVGPRTKILNTKIGKFCSIGPDVIICPGKHPTDVFVSTHPAFYSVRGQTQDVFSDKDYFEESAPVTIGNDVWIGGRAVIFDGLKIGDGAIIAFGAIVTKDVPPYAIVGGVPAKVIKFRFDSEQIDFLTTIKWWDREKSVLRNNCHLFRNIIDFINEFKK